jgi:hypothetical protein
MPGEGMKRDNLYLTMKQFERLRQRAEKEGIPMAELVRRAMDAYLAWDDPTYALSPRPNTRNAHSEAEPLDVSYSTVDSYDFSAYEIQKQRQAYASQAQEYEYSFNEDGANTASRWQKATSYPRRKAQKGWWAIVAITALLFFLLGTGVIRWITPVITPMPSSSTVSIVPKRPVAVQQPQQPQQPQLWPPPHNFSFFMNPIFTNIAAKEVAYALHLTPEQITIIIVNRNYGLSAIAADQGILFYRLYPIEQKAVNDMLDAEINTGYCSSAEATQWKNQFWDDQGKLDNVVGSMFSGYPVDISY